VRRINNYAKFPAAFDKSLPVVGKPRTGVAIAAKYKWNAVAKYRRA